MNYYSNRIEYPGTIQCICKANVGRSQMLVGFLREWLSSPVMGSGVYDFRDKYNNRPHPAVVDVMARRGIDISQQLITPLEPRWIFKDTTAIVLCEREIVPDYVFTHSYRVFCPPIEDPYDDGFANLDRFCDEIFCISGMFQLSFLGESENPHRNPFHTYDDGIFLRDPRAARR